jgi:hypothetical protein
MGHEKTAANTISEILGRISYWCEKESPPLPLLTALVVNQEKGKPSTANPDPRWNNLDIEREKVFNYKWFDIVIPSPDELLPYPNDISDKAAS